jgi:1,2-phenylacetyl-CoA epoxidase PaaB subunit
MSRYEVRFIKNISDATGHDHRVCQRVVGVEAGDAGSAISKAQDLFCRLERVGSWTVHADAFELDCLPAAPAGQGLRRA